MAPSSGTRVAAAIQSDGAALCALIQQNNHYLGGCFGWNGYKPGYYKNSTSYVKPCPTFKSGVPTWCSWTGE